MEIDLWEIKKRVNKNIYQGIKYNSPRTSDAASIVKQEGVTRRHDTSYLHFIKITILFYFCATTHISPSWLIARLASHFREFVSSI